MLGHDPQPTLHRISLYISLMANIPGDHARQKLCQGSCLRLLFKLVLSLNGHMWPRAQDFVVTKLKKYAEFS